MSKHIKQVLFDYYKESSSLIASIILKGNMDNDKLQKEAIKFLLKYNDLNLLRQERIKNLLNW